MSRPDDEDRRLRDNFVASLDRFLSGLPDGEGEAIRQQLAPEPLTDVEPGVVGVLYDTVADLSRQVTELSDRLDEVVVELSEDVRPELRSLDTLTDDMRKLAAALWQACSEHQKRTGQDGGR